MPGTPDPRTPSTLAPGAPQTPHHPGPYLGGGTDPEGPEDDVHHPLGSQDVAPHHGSLRRGVQDGALGDDHPHGGQAALGGGHDTHRTRLAPQTDPAPHLQHPKPPPSSCPRAAGAQTTPRGEQGPRTPPPHPGDWGPRAAPWVNRVPGPPQPRGLGSQNPLTPREALGWQLPPTAPAQGSSGGSALLGRGMQGGSHSPGGLKAWGFQSPGSPTARGVPQP